MAERSGCRGRIELVDEPHELVAAQSLAGDDKGDPRPLPSTRCRTITCDGAAITPSRSEFDRELIREMTGDGQKGRGLLASSSGASENGWMGRIGMTVAVRRSGSALAVRRTMSSAVAPILSRKASMGWYGRPSTDNISSPNFKPAFSAGEPSSTPSTKFCPSTLWVKTPIPG
jgi:hypothetical protein